MIVSSEIPPSKKLLGYNAGLELNVSTRKAPEKRKHLRDVDRLLRAVVPLLEVKWACKIERVTCANRVLICGANRIGGTREGVDETTVKRITGHNREGPDGALFHFAGSRSDRA